MTTTTGHASVGDLIIYFEVHGDPAPSLDKLGGVFAEPDFTEDQIRGIAAPTLVTVGDSDMVTLDHALAFFRLRGGDVNGDFDGLPAAQLAVLPGTTHFGGYANPELVLAVLRPFLSAAD